MRLAWRLACSCSRALALTKPASPFAARESSGRFHGRGIIILQDGVPLNLADGSFDMQAIEPLGLQYIEVFRGANALQYGATTLGGAINFVAPTGYTADELRARGEIGSFGYYKGFGSTGGVVGNFDYNVSASYSNSDGYRDWARQENARLFGNMGWRLNADLETRFYLTALNSDSQLPGSITKAQAASNPEQANPANFAGQQKRDFPLYRLANKTSYRMGDGVLEASAFYSYKDLWHPIFQVIDQVSNDYGVGLRYVTQAPLAGYQNQFVVGFIPQWGTVNDNRFVNVQGTAGARTGQSEQDSSNYVLYAENSLSLTPQWVGILGLQATWADRKLEDQFLQNGDQSVDQSYNQTSPKIGVLYKLVARDRRVRQLQRQLRAAYLRRAHRRAQRDPAPGAEGQDVRNRQPRLPFIGSVGRRLLPLRSGRRAAVADQPDGPAARNGERGRHAAPGC